MEYGRHYVNKINGDMMTTGRVAIPYYGKLASPISGFERIFFIIEHEENRPIKSNSISLGIWDARQTPLLPSWLQELGINQVICSKTPDETLLETMLESGIRVISEGSETALKVLKQLNII